MEQLIWGFSFSIISAAVNIAYFLKNTNGKAILRLFTGVVMLYFAFVFAASFFGYIPISILYEKYIQSWMIILFFIPVFDAHVDWKHKGIK